MEYTITTKGFSAKEMLKVQSLLRLFDGRSRGRWIFVESTEADVILYDADQPEIENSLPKSKLAVAYSTQTPEKKESLFLGKPMRVHEFNRLLNRMERIIVSHQAGAIILTEDWQTFDPSQYCLGLLQAALEDKKARLLNFKGLPPIYLEPQEKHYYSAMALDELAPLLIAPRDDIEEEMLTEQELLKIVEKYKLKPLSIEPLLWFAALQCSQGRLLADHVADVECGLIRWPNFSILPHRREHLALAVYMANHMDTLSEVVLETGVPLKTVIDFTNACQVSGLVTSQ